MPTVDVVRDGLAAPSAHQLLAHASGRGRGVLVVRMESGEGVSLGRYHLDGSRPVASRRATGGRVVRAGVGCLRVQLALPHRSALESEDPSALAPARAMNRCVRGMLGGLEALGTDSVYPGRDVVTVAGRPVGWLALTEEPSGAALFEGGLDLRLLDRNACADEAAERAVDAVLRGYERRLGLELAALPVDTLPVRDEVALCWARPPAASRVGEVATMLGCLRADVGLDERHHVTVCRLSGDVIAPEHTMLELERALAGVPALRGTIQSAVDAVLRRPGRWVLGIDGSDVTGAVLAAVAS